MTEPSIAGAIPNPSIVLPTGKAVPPLKAGQANAFKAKAGSEHYGNLKKKDADEQLLDNVGAKPTREDAKPVDAEGTGLTLESAFIQAPEGGNEAAMPGQLAQGSQPSAQGAAGASSNEGNNLGGQGFAYAGANALLLAQAETSITAGASASAAATPGDVASNIVPLGILGIVGLGVGAASAAGGSSAPATVARNVDTLAPTLLITSSVAAVKTGETATITFTFSEATSNFVVGDILTSSGSLGNFTAVSSTVYTATFTPTASLGSGSASITVASGNYTDAAGNNGGAGTTPTISIDTLAPTLLITSSVAAVKTGETATITFTFSEATSNFVVGDILTSSGSLGNFTAVSSTVYTATFTPTASLGSGSASITVASGNYTDAAGNNGGAGTTPTISIDTLAPTLLITSSVAAVKTGETATITFTFSEATSNFVVGDILTSSGSLGNFTAVSSTVYTATFTPTASLGSGSASITVASGNYTDAAGNNGGAGTTPTISIDTLAPTLLITSSVAAVKTGETATITFTFSEATSNFVVGDILTSSGSLGNFTAVSSTVYTATFTPTASLGSGSASITVASGNYTDAAGNNGGAGTTPTISIDTLAPTLLITSSVAAVKTGETATITFTFSEATSNFVVGDILTSSGSLGNFTAVSSTVYTATFTPTASLGSGSASITVASGNYTDAAGNNGGAGTTPTISIDTLAPTLLITSSVAAVKTGETATITFTFSEATSNFVVGDILTSSGSLGNFTAVSSTVYTATFTPTASLGSGSASITVASGNYTDAAGNNGGAGTTPTISIDTLAPTLLITSSVAAVKTGETATITFTFSEATSNFVVGDILTSSGSLGNFTAVSSTVYTATFTPTASLGSGSASITVASGNYTDAAGNNGGAGTTPTISIDTLAPTLLITSSVAAVKTGETATITFTFSEATSNFVVGDILTSSGSLGNFTAVSSTVYTATFTPTASLGSGSASITVASGNYTDAAGNNGGAGTTPTISIDTLAPTAPVINVVATDGIINAAEVGGVITGTNESGASVALSIAANVRVATVAGTIWSYTLVAADIIAMGEGAETLRATQTDAAGNTSAARTRDVTVDTLAPTATIVMDDVELAAGETSIVTIDFTEAVTNFDNADVTVQNGTLNTLATTNGGITWSGLFTPDIVIVDEITNVVSLANTYTDQAGNVGTVATSANYTVLAIVLQDAITLSASAFKVGETSTVTIPFFETSTISATHVVDSLAWNLTYTDGTPDEVRACFLAATNFWSSILTDGITVNLTVGLEALDPKILGGAVSVYASGTYAAFRAAMAGDASSANDALAVAALASGESFGMLLNHNSNNPNGPSSANAYTDNDADANNTTILSTRANAKALGLLGVSSDSDGSITFNSAFAAAGLFDYDRSDGIDAGKIDFLGIAIHEIGHALGFSSGVDVLDQLPGYLDSTYTYVAPLDLYRYSTASTALGIIDWTASKSDKYFSLNNGTTKIASFSTGTIHGDGSPPSHWKDALGLGAMDPTVATGELLNFTNLDLIAFDVIGWNLAAGLTNQVL